MKLEMTKTEFIDEVVNPFIITLSIMIPIWITTIIYFINTKG